MDVDRETNDDKKGVLSCESATGPFICGACDENVHSICSLHVHMLGKHSDGSYHYDNLIRTAFPKYDSCCIGTQTSKMDKMYLKQYRRSRKGKPPKSVHKKNMNSIVGKHYIVCKLDEKHDEHGLKDKPLDDDENVKQNVRKHDTHSRYNFRRITQLDGLRDCSVALDTVSFTEFDNKLDIANDNIHVSNNNITVEIPHSKYDPRGIYTDGNIEGQKKDTTSPSSDALIDVVVKTDPDIASSGNTFDMGLISHDFNDDWDDGESAADIPIMDDDVPEDDSGRIAYPRQVASTTHEKIESNENNNSPHDKPLDDDENVKQNVRKHDTHRRHNFRRIPQLDGLRDCSVSLDPVSFTEFDNKLDIANENIHVSNNNITVNIPHSKYDPRAIDTDGNIEGQKKDTTSPSSDALIDVVVKTEPDIASSGNTFDMGLLSHDVNDDWDDGESAADIPIMDDDVPEDDSRRIAYPRQVASTTHANIESNENNDSPHDVFSSANHNRKRINAIQNDDTNNTERIIPATKRTRIHISMDYRDRGDTSDEFVDNYAVVRKKEKTLKRKYKKKTSKETKDKSQEVKQIRTKAYKTGTFICHICGMQLHKRRRDTHMNKHLKHPVEPSRCICDVCGLSFASTQGLQRHKMRHDTRKGIGEFRCSECPRVFIEKDEYAAHMNVHSGARPYRCTQCDNGYGSERGLKIHVRRVHDKVRNWTCDECGNKYFSRYHLSVHYARHHMAPSLPCKYCDRLFKSTEVRRNHEFTHTGEKRYTCCVCKHAFIQWTPFLGHMMKQHGFSKEETVKVKKWKG